MQGGTNLVSNKFKSEEWEVNSYSENRTIIQSDASMTGWGAYGQKQFSSSLSNGLSDCPSLPNENGGGTKNLVLIQEP